MASPVSSPRSSSPHGSDRSDGGLSRGASPLSSGQKGHKRSRSSVSVIDSPLQQMNVEAEPQFKLKVSSLYERLFEPEHHSPGYWIEFFLLPVDKNQLAETVRAAAPLSQHEATVQTLVSAAIANLRPELPEDIVLNALGVLEVVFREVLDLSVLTPSSSIIQILVGIERVSHVFDEFTANLLALLHHKSPNVISSATDTILAIARKSWGTPLNTLFSTKNFFAAFIDVIGTHEQVASKAFVTIGVLTAINTYNDDGPSIYLQRISDYVDEALMIKIIAVSQRELSHVLPSERAGNSGGVSGWLSSFFKGTSNGLSAENSPVAPAEWQVILPLHFFVMNNSIFTQAFATSPALATLLMASATSFENVMRSAAAASRVWFTELLLRKLVDTEFVALSDPAMATVIRLEASKLALDTSRRVPLAGILDLAQIGLRSVVSSKKVDALLLQQLVDLISQVCSQMVITNTIWQYNWPRLWKTMMALIKHLAAKSIFEKPATRLLNTLVGMAMHRDILDEEDWSFLIYSIVQNPTLVDEFLKGFPDCAEAPAVKAARAMITQYELGKDTPDLPTVMKQGKLAAGRASSLVGDKLRSFNVLTEPSMKRVAKAMVRSDK